MKKNNCNEVFGVAISALLVGAVTGVLAVKAYEKHKDEIVSFGNKKKQSFIEKKIAFKERQSENFKKRKDDLISQVKKIKIFSGKSEPVVIDVDGDGIPDTVAMDTTGDGHIDTVAVDTTGDGNVDTVLLDSDGDGELDTTVNIQAADPE